MADDLDLVLVRKKIKALEINRIKSKISERGISQKWIADKLCKTTNTVNGWCCNKVQPHLVDLCLLSVLLSCSVHELIEDIGPHHFNNSPKK